MRISTTAAGNGYVSYSAFCGLMTNCDATIVVRASDILAGRNTCTRDFSNADHSLFYVKEIIGAAAGFFWFSFPVDTRHFHRAGLWKIDSQRTALGCLLEVLNVRTVTKVWQFFPR